jgi:macrodomain Ter protein organizer (MatP/YcbG family)
MEQGKDPLVNPSDAWVRDYHANVEQQHHHHRGVRRRRRRRFVAREQSARRRILRLALVCSAALIVMAASLYLVLSHTERNEASSQSTSARVVIERPA